MNLRTSLTGRSFIALLLAGAFSSALLAPQTAFAADDDESDTDYVSYDKIVDDLQTRTRKATRDTSSSRASSRGWFSSNSSDPFENVWIHAGVAFAQTTQNIELPNGTGAHMAARGVQASLGIDILGPRFTAEGSVRNFGESGDASTKIALKEFDLKVFFKTKRERTALRAGGGLSARYMSVRSGIESFDVTTPASILQLGGDIYLTPALSLGLDVSARTAMISDTFDRASYDGTIRLDTHF